MKVLVGYTVSKTLTEDNMDSVINLPSNGKVRNSSIAVEREPDQVTGNGVNKWRRLFLQIQKDKGSQSDSSNCSNCKACLFGHQLSNICGDQQSLPKPIKDILMLLLRRGPSTEGIFRKPGNAKRLREIKEQLDRGLEVNMEEEQLTLLATLLKDFLRHIPGGLLVANQHQAWMAAMEVESSAERCQHLKLVIHNLPHSNTLLLQHLLCVLLHISRNSTVNKMNAENLAVCISPSLLHWDDVHMMEKVTFLTQFLIENCCEIFGEHIQTLLGDPDDEESSDNLDMVSLHQQDLAYESNDPDTDCDLGVSIEGHHSIAFENRQNELKVDSVSSRATYHTSSPFNRRCSEPIINPVAGMKAHIMLARSHDDLEKERLVSKQLKKQNSENSFLLLNQSPKRLLPFGANLTTELTANHTDSSYSSSCSLESASSSVSDDIFTSTVSITRSKPSRQSFSTVRGEEAKSCLRDGKRRSMSMRIEKSKNPKFRNRWSLKKQAKEDSAIQSETVQNDVERNTEPVRQTPRPRPRSLSTTEVFQLVDSRTPSRPPSYVQAINGTDFTIPSQVLPKTVQDARDLFGDRKGRPVSMTEGLLKSSAVDCPSERCCYQGTDKEPAVATPLVVFRQRAMSESLSETSHRRLSRRISQPLMEAILSAKESYV